MFSFSSQVLEVSVTVSIRVHLKRFQFPILADPCSSLTHLTNETELNYLNVLTLAFVSYLLIAWLK